MTETLERNTLERWQRNPIRFIEEVLRDSDGQPYRLFPAQRTFFQHAWQLTEDGRLLYPEQCLGWIKKTGKTETAAMHVLVTTLVFGGRYAEGYCIASDLEQAQGRVFAAIKRMCECSPLLAREADITANRIQFPQTGAVITAISHDYASAAGAQPTISSFDELWTYVSERSRRLWDEMIPVPTRQISCRLTTTHAGYETESTLLLEIYKRGLALPEIAPDLHAGNHLLFTWSHVPLAPWQTQAEMDKARELTRPIQYLRQYENRFVTSESAFIDMAKFDACVNDSLGQVPFSPTLPVHIGVDASYNHDNTAIVVVHFDKKTQMARLCFHRVFQPTPDRPLDFEQTIERTLLDLSKRYRVHKILFDPWQMQAVSQRLVKAGLPIEPFPQTAGNLTAASQNLFDLIESQSIILYPDAGIRLAVSRAVAKESARGWKIAKERQSHKIDVVVALAMAAYSAVQAGNEFAYDRTYAGFRSSVDPDAPNGQSSANERLLNLYLGIANGIRWGAFR
jgi:phage terminase large subunit-like protein